jgi:hypothetical protein
LQEREAYTGKLSPSEALRAERDAR